MRQIAVIADIARNRRNRETNLYQGSTRDTENSQDRKKAKQWIADIAVIARHRRHRNVNRRTLR